MYKVTVTIEAGQVNWAAEYCFATKDEASRFSNRCYAAGYKNRLTEHFHVSWEVQAAWNNLVKFVHQVQ